jgi:hypothetical protein
LWQNGNDGANALKTTPFTFKEQEKFKVNVERRVRRASSMVKPREVRGSNNEERITKPL